MSTSFDSTGIIDAACIAYSPQIESFRQPAPSLPVPVAPVRPVGAVHGVGGGVCSAQQAQELQL